MLPPFAVGVNTDEESLIAAGGPSLPRRSSCNPTAASGNTVTGDHQQQQQQQQAVYRVLMLGGPGVGKTAITQQFVTSEYMAAQNTSFDDGREITVPVLLNGIESIMEFVDLPYSGDPDMWRDCDVDGYIVVYSITDRRSYQKASDVISSIRSSDDVTSGSAASSRPIIVVANKSDLERSRMIGKEEGKTLAQNYNGKYIEVSAILNHRVDELLVGTLRQIRLSIDAQHQHNHHQQQQGSAATGGGSALPSATAKSLSYPGSGGSRGGRPTQLQRPRGRWSSVSAADELDDDGSHTGGGLGCLSQSKNGGGGGGAGGVLSRLLLRVPHRATSLSSKSCANLLTP